MPNHVNTTTDDSLEDFVVSKKKSSKAIKANKVEAKKATAKTDEKRKVKAPAIKAKHHSPSLFSTEDEEEEENHSFSPTPIFRRNQEAGDEAFGKGPDNTEDRFDK